MLELSDEVRKMSSSDILTYSGKYVDMDGSYEHFVSYMCDDCAAMTVDSSIGFYDCPAGGEPGDPACVRYWQLIRKLEYLVEADIRLKEVLG